MDSGDPSLRPGRLADTRYGEPAGRLVGLSRARLGRLLGLGSGRERRDHALVRRDSLHPLGHDPGAAWDAEGLEPGAAPDHLQPGDFRHLRRSQRGDLLGPLLRDLSGRALVPGAAGRYHTWLARSAALANAPSPLGQPARID